MAEAVVALAARRNDRACAASALASHGVVSLCRLPCACIWQIGFEKPQFTLRERTPRGNLVSILDEMTVFNSYSPLGVLAAGVWGVGCGVGAASVGEGGGVVVGAGAEDRGRGHTTTRLSLSLGAILELRVQNRTK